MSERSDDNVERVVAVQIRRLDSLGSRACCERSRSAKRSVALAEAHAQLNQSAIHNEHIQHAITVDVRELRCTSSGRRGQARSREDRPARECSKSRTSSPRVKAMPPFAPASQGCLALLPSARRTSAGSAQVSAHRCSRSYRDQHSRSERARHKLPARLGLTRGRRLERHRQGSLFASWIFQLETASTLLSVANPVGGEAARRVRELPQPKCRAAPLDLAIERGRSN